MIGEFGTEPIAYMLSFPDYNPAIRASGGKTDPLSMMRFLAASRGIRTGSAFSGGVLPGSEGKGLGKSMLAATLLAMKRRRYPTCYCHTVTETRPPGA